MNVQVNPEYSAVRDGGAGLIDLSTRGRIIVGGSEAVMFLNGMITNDIKTLAVNTWMPAVFPNVQGRVLAVVRVLNLGNEFLIDTEHATRSTVVNLLSRFTMAGDFRVTDVTEQISTLSVQGRGAVHIIHSIFGEAANVERWKLIIAEFNGASVKIIRATHTSEDGFDCFIDIEKVADLRQALIAKGAFMTDDGAFEVLRIEAGIPRYGVDLDDTTVVNEVGFDEAISFSKGCYVGQEIIVRITHRGHVAKKLTGLILEAEIMLERGAKILSADNKEVGRITSSTFSPRLDRTIALGYVKFDYLAPGTKLKIIVEDRLIAAEVTELPFVRGSWHED